MMRGEELWDIMMPFVFLYTDLSGLGEKQNPVSLFEPQAQ